MARARYTYAGRLREAGFTVIHTPGRLGSQKGHVTIAWSDDVAQLYITPWPIRVTETFDSCFNEPTDDG